MAISMKKKSLPLFIEVDIFGLSEIFCVLHGCSILMNRKQGH